MTNLLKSATKSGMLVTAAFLAFVIGLLAYWMPVGMFGYTSWLFAIGGAIISALLNYMFSEEGAKVSLWQHGFIAAVALAGYIAGTLGFGG